jgi:predicted DNA-binding transcriptional regulator AlpA
VSPRSSPEPESETKNSEFSALYAPVLRRNDRPVAGTDQAFFGTKMLTTSEVAELLCVSRRTVEDWRLRGDGPPFVRLTPGVVRYKPSTLAAWCDQREMLSTSDTRRSA